MRNVPTVTAVAFASATFLSFLMSVGCSPFRGDDASVVRIVRKGGQTKARRLTQAAIHEVGVGKVDAAAAKLSNAIAADPGYGPAHNTLGLMHYSQEHFYQAVLAFEEASRLMPGNADARFNLALALEAGGRVDEARAIYEEINALYPENPIYLGNLARLLIRTGEVGPPVRAMLRDLALIETRPNWRAWADRLLAIDLNDQLDRGPPTPDFNNDPSRDPADIIPIDEKIIDLSVDAESMPLSIVLPSPTSSSPAADSSPSEASPIDALELDLSSPQPSLTLPTPELLMDPPPLGDMLRFSPQTGLNRNVPVRPTTPPTAEPADSADAADPAEATR